MKKPRILLATIVVTVANIFINAVTCGGMFNWVYKIEPTYVWKSITEITYPTIFISTFIVDLIFVFIYTLIEKNIPTQNNYIKGIVYGLIVCGVGLIPSIVSTYLYMNVATGVVIYWTIMGIIINPVKGIITAMICNKE